MATEGTDIATELSGCTSTRGTDSHKTSPFLSSRTVCHLDIWIASGHPDIAAAGGTPAIEPRATPSPSSAMYGIHNTTPLKPHVLLASLQAAQSKPQNSFLQY